MKEKFFEYRGVTYLSSDGSPFDRGSADAYYHRPIRPHYRLYREEHLIDENMPEHMEAYLAGYKMQVESGCFKDWGDDEPVYDSEADYEY